MVNLLFLWGHCRLFQLEKPVSHTIHCNLIPQEEDTTRNEEERVVGESPKVADSWKPLKWITGVTVNTVTIYKSLVYYPVLVCLLDEVFMLINLFWWIMNEMNLLQVLRYSYTSSHSFLFNQIFFLFTIYIWSWENCLKQYQKQKSITGKYKLSCK